MGSHFSPSPRPWSFPHQQMSTDTALLKGLSALLGGDVHTGKAGGRQPGPSSGLSSGAFCRGKNGTLEFTCPGFSSYSTIQKPYDLDRLP